MRQSKKKKQYLIKITKAEDMQRRRDRERLLKLRMYIKEAWQILQQIK